MVDSGIRIEFMERQLDSMSAEQLYQNFRYFYDKFSPSCTNDPAGRLRDCLRYLKRLLTHHSPDDCARAISRFNKVNFDQTKIEDEYIYLLTLVTMLHIHFEDYEAVPYWAKKALDLIPYFHPQATNDEMVRRVIMQNENYGYAEAFHENYIDWFDWDVYFDLMTTFEWERKKFHPDTVANQNFTHKIFD